MQSEIILNKLGAKIKVQVRLSFKASRLGIAIKNNIVELILPGKMLTLKKLTIPGFLNKKSQEQKILDKIIQDGNNFLLKKESWIRQKLKQRDLNLSDYDKEMLPIYNIFYKLLYIDAERRDIQIRENEIHIFSHSSLHDLTLIRFLKNKLLQKVITEINQLKPHFKQKIANIKITNTKTKWGSYSSKGVLSFNWRLIFAPENIINYVIIHEMCHLVEMNHSKNFWLLVHKFYPDYKLAKLWLKNNGNRLNQYLN